MACIYISQVADCSDKKIIDVEVLRRWLVVDAVPSRCCSVPQAISEWNVGKKNQQNRNYHNFATFGYTTITITIKMKITFAHFGEDALRESASEQVSE